MLLILMYHRVHAVGCNPSALATHLAYLRDHHPIVLPGECLEPGRTNICLTFDDATVDFYHLVFPLLHKLAIHAVVAVPTAWIKTTTATDMAQRLLLQNAAASKQGAYAMVPDGLCTWEELREMQASGLVCCASHGHNHLDMSRPNTAVEQELNLSRATLMQHLGSMPNTFIYPYGRTNSPLQTQVAQHFPYAMRIGAAINKNWAGNRGLLYRVNAEHFWPTGRKWSFVDTAGWQIKYLINRLRNK